MTARMYGKHDVKVCDSVLQLRPAVVPAQASQRRMAGREHRLHRRRCRRPAAARRARRDGGGPRTAVCSLRWRARTTTTTTATTTWTCSTARRGHARGPGEDARYKARDTDYTRGLYEKYLDRIPPEYHEGAFPDQCTGQEILDYPGTDLGDGRKRKGGHRHRDPAGPGEVLSRWRSATSTRAGSARRGPSSGSTSSWATTPPSPPGRWCPTRSAPSRARPAASVWSIAAWVPASCAARTCSTPRRRGLVRDPLAGARRRDGRRAAVRMVGRAPAGRRAGGRARDRADGRRRAGRRGLGGEPPARHGRSRRRGRGSRTPPPSRRRSPAPRPSPSP